MSDPAVPLALPEIASMSFEQALEELEAIVRQLEAGRFKLDEAIGSYERGAALRRHCETKLNEAKMTVERIVGTAETGIALQPQAID